MTKGMASDLRQVPNFLRPLFLGLCRLKSGIYTGSLCRLFSRGGTELIFWNVCDQSSHNQVGGRRARTVFPRPNLGMREWTTAPHQESPSTASREAFCRRGARRRNQACEKVRTFRSLSIRCTARCVSLRQYPVFPCIGPSSVVVGA